MIKTQIQLPDAMHREIKRVAREREMSLAEVVRRGIETVLARYPESPSEAEWTLPEPRPLDGDAFFDQPDWRFQANQPALVRDQPAKFKSKRGKSGR